MSAKITKIWSDVVQVSFTNEALPAINTLLKTANNAYLIVKKVIDEKTLLAVLVDSQDNLAIGQEIQVLNHSFQVPVGNLSKGHIYDILGNNLSSPEITNVTKVEMNSTIKK